VRAISLLTSLTLACAGSPAPTAAPPPPEPTPMTTPQAPPPARLALLAEGRVLGLSEASAGAIVEIDGARWLVLGDDDKKKEVFVAPVPGRDGEQVRAEKRKRSGSGGEAKLDDLEGATRHGPATWWLTSHGKADDKNRNLLVRADAEGRTVLSTTTLAFLRAPPPSGLAAALAALVPPASVDPAYATAESKLGGLDFEGLSITPDGSLLLGLRGPLTTDGQAIVLSLPTGFADGAALGLNELGPTWLLPLRGRGVRSIDATGDGAQILVAGPPGDPIDDGEPAFALWRWVPGEPPVSLGALSTAAGRNPEVVLVEQAAPGSLSVLVLFDEGAQESDPSCTWRRYQVTW
jgi:hypothetical protein